MRLRENLSALLEWLHLEALGIRVSLRNSLVTLGGCRHLDGLEQRGSLSWGWWSSPAPIVVIVRGLVPSPAERRKVTLVDFSCHWVTSLMGRFLRCPIVWTRFRATPLSRQTTKCWSTQRGLACWQAREPREKNWLSLALWFSPGDWFSIHLVIGSLLYAVV